MHMYMSIRMHYVSVVSCLLAMYSVTITTLNILICISISAVATDYTVINNLQLVLHNFLIYYE